MLVGLEGFSYARAARILKISRSILVARLARARERLPKNLQAPSAVRAGRRRARRICASSNKRSASMSAHFPPPSDDELHGFLDGELSADRRSAIETFLKTSPIHAERVEGWRRQSRSSAPLSRRSRRNRRRRAVLLSPPAGRRAFLHLLRPCADDPAMSCSRQRDWPLLRRKGAAAAARLWRACATPLAYLQFLWRAPSPPSPARFSLIASTRRRPPTSAPAASVSADDSPGFPHHRGAEGFQAAGPRKCVRRSARKVPPGSHQTSLVVPNLSSAVSRWSACARARRARRRAGRRNVLPVLRQSRRSRRGALHRTRSRMAQGRAASMSRRSFRRMRIRRRDQLASSERDLYARGAA